ncbi:ATP synthase subunit beta [Striga asiatica]|uniref:ATP synthase subunit beta n=1 Tax=Striga asiatica TaxID=4170 RepID=A0A5A7PL21_STRAF|nr:ATP synthase subunit beta [Striga asiatica]
MKQKKMPLHQSVHQDGEPKPTSAAPHDSPSDEPLFVDPTPRTPSIIPTTSDIVGRWPAALTTHPNAIRKTSTNSSSILSAHLRNSTSKTSAVHSSRTTEWTHRTRWTISSPLTVWTAVFPVSSSSRTTPNPYTSDACWDLRVSVTSGARYPAARATGGDNGLITVERPKSDTQPDLREFRKTLDDLMLPWTSFPPFSMWTRAMPRAAPFAMFSRVSQSSGARLTPLLPEKDGIYFC